MNKRIEHKNYPDYCKVYTFKEQTQFQKGTEEVIYEGECVKYGSSQMRKFVNGNVIKADFCVDIPYIVPNIRSGRKIDVVDAQGSFLKCEIVLGFADTVFGLGTTVFFNVAMN